MMRGQKGITLIALVITIIVMLILVGVTISMAVNGGLFNYAKNAVTDTEAAKQNESHLGDGFLTVTGVSGLNDKSINDIVNHYKTVTTP